MSRVSGTLPDSFGAWRNVVAVQASHTQISGTLPPSWHNMGKLQQLQLYVRMICSTTGYYVREKE